MLFVGLSLGADEGKKLPDGASLGEPDGASDGEELGFLEGDSLGLLEGASLGDELGDADG